VCGGGSVFVNKCYGGVEENNFFFSSSLDDHLLTRSLFADEKFDTIVTGTPRIFSTEQPQPYLVQFSRQPGDYY